MSVDNTISAEQTVSKLIVVEGKDDAALFRALCYHVSLTQSFVHDANGEANLRRVIKNLASGLDIKPLSSEKKRIPEQRVLASQLTHLLLVRDADKSVQNAQSKLEKALKAYPDSQNLALPSKPLEWSDAEGAFGLRTGIVILHGDEKTGALEDFMYEAIKPGMRDCIRGFRECLSLPGKFNGKQVMQLYLGASAVDGRRFADSFGREDDFWDLDHPVFAPLVTFLKQAAT